MNTTTITSFINIISELTVSVSNLLDETDLAFKNHCISEEFDLLTSNIIRK